MRRLGVLVVGLMLAGFVATFGSAGRVGAQEVPECNGYDATIWFTGNHTINGTSHADVIVGSDDDDIINGNGGDDVICGLDGDDTIHGNTGNDEIAAGRGDDWTYGDAGNDVLRGNFFPNFLLDVQDEGLQGADDHIYGGTGNDVLIDFFGWNYFDGGSANDDLYGWGELHGNSGNDHVSNNFWFFLYDYYDFNNASVNDICNASDDDSCDLPASILDGGSGNDLLVGTWFDEILTGGSGGDGLFGEGGDDSYNGGSGRDTCAEPGTSCEVIDD